MYANATLRVIVVTVGVLVSGVAGVRADESQSTEETGRFGSALRFRWFHSDLHQDASLPPGASQGPAHGWAFSAELRRTFSRSLEFGLGMGFENRGFEQRYHGPFEVLGFTLEANLRYETVLWYLNLTPRLKITSGGPGVQVYARPGVDLGFLLRSETHTTGYIRGNAGVAPIDQKSSGGGGESFHTFEMALASELGVSFPLGKVRGFLEATGAWGLTDISTSDETEATLFRWGLGLGIEF